MTYDEGLALFRRGRLQQLIEQLNRTSSGADSDSRLRVLLAYTLALVDDTTDAVSVLTKTTRVNANAKSLWEATLGLSSWRSRNRADAARHLLASIKIANDANDLERVAWGHLHLLRIAIENDPPTAIASILREARAAVTSAGLPYLSAYLHVCVSVVEWQ